MRAADPAAITTPPASTNFLTFASAVAPVPVPAVTSHRLRRSGSDGLPACGTAPASPPPPPPPAATAAAGTKRRTRGHDDDVELRTQRRIVEAGAAHDGERELEALEQEARPSRGHRPGRRIPERDARRRQAGRRPERRWSRPRSRRAPAPPSARSACWPRSPSRTGCRRDSSCRRPSSRRPRR